MTGTRTHRDPTAGRATSAAMHYEDAVSIGGTTIRVDRDTAKAILKALNIREDSRGQYTATLRDKPLESEGIAPPTGRAQRSELRVDVDPTKARNVCDICGNADPTRALAVDHDHSTLRLRGFLCGRCNSGLGFFRDHPENLRRAALYLESPPGVSVSRFVNLKSGGPRV